MIDLSSLFVSAALAQDAAPVADTASSGLGSGMLIPAVLIFLVYWFLVIQPSQKRLAEQDKLVKGLQKGDKVVTSGGIHGKVAKVEDDAVMLEIAEGVQIKIDKESIAGPEVKPQAKDAGKDKEGEKKA